MRLIDIDEIGVMPIDITDLPYDRCLLTYLKEDIDNAPTIKAIPLDKVKQAREEMENEVFESLADDGSDWFTADKVSECMAILDKLIESEKV